MRTIIQLSMPALNQREVLGPRSGKLPSLQKFARNKPSMPQLQAFRGTRHEVWPAPAVANAANPAVFALRDCQIAVKLLIMLA
jgi:hypothetical protein